MPQVRQDLEEYSALEGTHGGRMGDAESQRQGVGTAVQDHGKER